MTDDEIKTLIKIRRNNLTTSRERCWYEDSWTETVINDEAVFKLIKEVLENDRT